MGLPAHRYRPALDLDAPVVISLQELNCLPAPQFVAALSGVFERSPWVAERVAALRPFRSRLELHEAMCAAVERASIDEQLMLIRAHTELAGRAALRAELTPESTRGQRGAGLATCTPEEFGFPFVIAVKDHDRLSVIAALESRLENRLEHERALALREIGRIGGFRLAELVDEPLGSRMIAADTPAPGMSAVETAVAEIVDGGFAAECDFLASLVKIPTDNPPGDCAAHAGRARVLLEALGFAVEAHPVPVDSVRAAGMIAVTNLIARQRFGKGGPCVALNAHGDVVPPGLGWTRDPYGAQVLNDPAHGPTMYGRGVAVSKSDFATYAYALRALRELAKTGHALNGSVELHFTYDEEVGGDIGPRWLLAQGLSRPDYAICAGFSYAVTTAHNGCLHLEVTVRGRQGHAAMPDSGIDALAAATAILKSIYDSRETLKERRSSVPGITHSTLNVGLIEGGINTNVVPDRVSFRIDRRIIPEESPQQAEAQLRSIIELAATACSGIRVEIRRLLLALPLVNVPGAGRLSEALRRHGQAFFGVPIAEHGVPLYTDARHYAAAGIPTVLYGAGPRTLAEAHGHAADECLRLNDLRRATATVACAVAEILT